MADQKLNIKIITDSKRAEQDIKNITKELQSLKGIEKQFSTVAKISNQIGGGATSAGAAALKAVVTATKRELKSLEGLGSNVKIAIRTEELIKLNRFAKVTFKILTDELKSVGIEADKTTEKLKKVAPQKVSKTVIEQLPLQESIQEAKRIAAQSKLLQTVDKEEAKRFSEYKKSLARQELESNKVIANEKKAQNLTPLKQAQAELRKLADIQQRIYVASGKDSQAFQDNATKINALKNSIRELQGVSKGFSGKTPLSGLQLLEAGENLTVVAAGVKSAFGSISNSVGDFVGEANKLQAANLGLESIAKFKGIDPNAVTQSVTGLQLVKDGLLTVGDASLALKNLLATGFSLDESINLIKGFGDAAAFGRQSSLEFGYAITSATEGVKNQNSILVDNAGVTKNLSVILKEAGFSASDLQNVTTDLGVRTALYNGILKETKAQTGDANKLTNTFAGQQQKLGAQLTTLKQNFGELIQGALLPFITAITNSGEAAKTTAGGLVVVGGALGDIIPALALARIGFKDLIPAGLVSTMGTLGIGIGAVASAIYLMVKNIKYGIELFTSGGSFIDFLTSGSFNRADVTNKSEQLVAGNERVKKRLEYLEGRDQQGETGATLPSKEDFEKNKITTKGGKGGVSKTETAETLTYLAQLKKEIEDLKATIGSQSEGVNTFGGFLSLLAEKESLLFMIENFDKLNDIISETKTIIGDTKRVSIKPFEDDPINQFNIDRKKQTKDKENEKERLENIKSTFEGAFSDAQNIANIFGNTGVPKLLNDFSELYSIANSIFSLIGLFAGGGGGGLFGFVSGLFGGGGGSSLAGGAGFGNSISGGSLSSFTNRTFSTGGGQQESRVFIADSRVRGKDIVQSYRRVTNQEAKLLKVI